MRETFRRRRLPHWDLPGATYFVTTCLAGSIPSQGLLEIATYGRQLARGRRPAEFSEHVWRIRKWKLAFVHCEQWLDSGCYIRHLDDPRLAAIVAEAIYHFAGQRYDLLGYVVMPSHLHWVFRPKDEWVHSLGSTVDERSPRERIMHSLKLFTGRACNQLLSQRGSFWQAESYDHCVRDEDELERILHYVEQNPVAAGLISSPELWIFSSAYDRARQNLPLGKALVR